MWPSALKKGGPAKVPTLPNSVVPRAKIMVTGLHVPPRSFRTTLKLSLSSISGLGDGKADTLKARIAIITEKRSIVAVYGLLTGGRR